MPLTVHHLQWSQSERIPWLCEELEIPYTLTLHQRAPMLSPKAIRDLNPLGQAPVIQDGDLTLAESAACCEYIIHKFGNGRLALPPSHKDYADYLYWFHFSNGTLQPMVLLLFSVARVQREGPATTRYREMFERCLSFMDKRLRENEWLAGEEFTAADIMTVFSLTTMRAFHGFDLTKYEGILGYLKRVSEREGYKKARAKADPEMELMIDGKAPRQFEDKLKAEGKL
ncbi:glutathione S-transferase [Mytilinidion resinicola]|uniref:Glutathione S-transferase n=1 Tax=Mytilinidion resinicola TaxID=574789 RepID=A0A6A6YFN6_9PEZI|nr:glutathione S-transferase [Mytilinidion resinicola]KAF2806697.1 glutathione S-transferase [Mytilinidion resinicola]